jgi:hypothetical protein
MTTTTTVEEIDAAVRTDRPARVPWFIYAVLFASTSVLVGVVWDISWHQTIGRDTFWTPAHLAIYLGGVVAGLTCGWLALRTTFAPSAADRDASVRFWGFRAPFGAWVCIWGTFAMLTSAPFDDWWHNTYGLDVKILSPPHVVLAAGIGAIQVGAMLMALAWQNSAARLRRQRLPELLFIYAAGLLLLNGATLATEYIQRWDMHRSLFYLVVCGLFPFLLISAARASRARWAATMVAAAYTTIVFAMLWILPLFEGRPLLGPIYVPLDSFLPPDPPLLLIVPAMLVDLVMHWARRRAIDHRGWTMAAVLGVAFWASFAAAQWPFATFLMSDWSHNWVFATHRMAYMVPPHAQARWTEFNPSDDIAAGLALALVLAILSARAGLWRGAWMARVQR